MENFERVHNWNDLSSQKTHLLQFVKHLIRCRRGCHLSQDLPGTGPFCYSPTVSPKCWIINRNVHHQLSFLPKFWSGCLSKCALVEALNNSGSVLRLLCNMIVLLTALKSSRALHSPMIKSTLRFLHDSPVPFYPPSSTAPSVPVMIITEPSQRACFTCKTYRVPSRILVHSRHSKNIGCYCSNHQLRKKLVGDSIKKKYFSSLKGMYLCFLQNNSHVRGGWSYGNLFQTQNEMSHSMGLYLRDCSPLVQEYFCLPHSLPLLNLETFPGYSDWESSGWLFASHGECGFSSEIRNRNKLMSDMA